MIIERVPAAWAQFQMHVGGLTRPNSEEEYKQIVSLMHHISDNYSVANEPYAGLFNYLATLAHDWEAANEPGGAKAARPTPKVVSLLHWGDCRVEDDY